MAKGVRSPLKINLNIPYADKEKTFQIDERHLLYNFTPKSHSRTQGMKEGNIVKEAIQNPIGTDNIADLVSAGDKVALLVDDWTRPTPVYKVAPIVIDILQESGVRAKDIRIVFARGTHAPLSKEQMIEKLGETMVESFRCQNHDPKKNLAYLGESKKGTPVYINRFFVRADFKIAIGGICAHPIAGYGGGAKIIVPGIAGGETINHNHSRADSPKVGIGKVEGNPVREDMEDIARMAELDFIVNVILNPKREIIEAVAGDLGKAHKQGVASYERIYGIPVGEEADIVVLGATPRDATVYHGTFALPCAVPFAREGGTIIWVAPCLSGPGTKSSRQSFRQVLSISPDELMKSIKNGAIPASGGVFDWCTSQVMHRNKVVLVSDMVSRKEAEEFDFHYGESTQKALDQEIAAEKDAKVTVIPIGGLAVPIYNRS